MVFLGALLLLIASSTALFSFASSATLPAAEVDALREIGEVLGKRDWDFSVDPCSGLNNWVVPNTTKDNNNSVNCVCDNITSVCHVVSIQLKRLNLSGTLPSQLTKLPFLTEIDLSRNYLNGTIPTTWGSMPLVSISILGNRITGPIPKELGNISTLANLNLDYNMLSGPIPPEFGNLSSIERLILTSNYLTGELPGELAKLTTLTQFRISDNQFVGSIPNFIQDWRNLDTLMIQGSGLSGPIPSGISFLTNLTDLRISDLIGNDSSFPSLRGAANLESLTLRNCNITGQIPDYLGSVPAWVDGLKLLDLSFNKLTGAIPGNLENLVKVDRIYLTGNLLSGNVPDWMVNKGGGPIDLSYNNFTGSAVESNCRPLETNLFASSSMDTASGIVSCMSNNFACSSSIYSLHINCGGGETKLANGTVYIRDMESGSPSKFYQGNNWVFSSTGNYLDDNRGTDTYLRSSSNVTATGNDKDLYSNARTSPSSLTYYALCLGNGNYTVNLHFAEIVFTDDGTYASLGRRFFNIYIQGKLVKRDFNIEDEARGVGKPIVLPFTAEVSENTLEIRLFWAGKGTNAIPDRGSYGPLISAISIISDFPPPSSSSLSAGAIAGITLAVLFIISGVFAILWWKGCLPCKDSIDKDLKGLELHTGIFTLRQIKAATNNFDAANKIGEGGFGPVYKGTLGDGSIIAVKQLSAKSKQGNREFVNEIGMISALQHPHLVKLHGCCIEGNQLLLVYEYMENNSLARALFGPEQHRLELDWPTRHKICVGIARGLAYLHEESRLKIVHRDIKATNVLLDKDLNPKISDFGLAKLDEEDNTHISTRIAGTFGYMAPEYAMRGYLTDKADVYSFGVVLLEIVSGRGNTSIKQKQDCFYLLDWANELKEEGKLRDLIDPSLLGSDKNAQEIMLTLHIGLLCTNVVSTDRPSMSSVVSMLEGHNVDKKAISAMLSGGGGSSKKSKFKAMEIGGENQEVSMDVPFSAVSSASTSDLYPINIESDYLLRR